MISFEIREFRYPDDYPAALGLWKSMEKGIRIGPSDSPSEIEKKLLRDPDLFLVASTGGALIGTVIGGFDGRRGLVYHLAVAPEFRRGGVATRLMQELESRLRRKGCLRCYLLVRPDNHEAMHYYQQQGWDLLDDHLYARDLN